LIGAAGVMTTFMSWCVMRVISKKSSTPRFQFLECYEFMLYWPSQGVAISFLPVAAMSILVTICFNPLLDPMSTVYCSYQMDTDVISSEMKEECRYARTGTALLIGGFMMLWSASKMIVPRLRQVELNFLAELTTQELSEEGIPVPAAEKELVAELPAQWKRCHMIWISILICIPLLIMLEFSFCDFFGECTVHFIVMYSIMMMAVEGVFATAVRESLLGMPLGASCEVVLFVATMGADDFNDFCQGYFVELLIGIFERLALGSILRIINTYLAILLRFVRTRSWMWDFVILITGGRTSAGLQYNKIEMEEEEDEDDFLEDKEELGVQIEEAMDEHIGGGAGCMSLVMAPFVILIIQWFEKESQIPAMYGIRIADLRYYLLFGLVVAPFQVWMEIYMNHATEFAHGVRIYDYMMYAKWRWNNRMCRWLFDDPRFDDSVGAAVQSTNHLCFSPQFYFIAAYFSWGICMVLIAIQTLLRNEHNPFADPGFFWFVLQQFVINRVLDNLITWLTRTVLWKPKDNAPTRMFTEQIAVALKQREATIHAHEWRSKFFLKHQPWFLQNLNNVFSPRAVQRYRPRLRAMYQSVLNLQPKHAYRKPILPSEEPKSMVMDVDSDDISEPTKDALEDETKQVSHLPPMRLALPWPLCGPKGPQAIEDDKLPDGVQTQFARNLALAWYRVAIARVQESRLAEQWKRHLTTAGECRSCGVRADDAATFKEDSLWGSAGPCLRIVETKNIYDLLATYEGDHQDEWRQLLEEECWATLCWRCANLQGFRQAPAAEAGSDLSSSIASSDGEAGRFVDWMEVNVTPSSREMLLTWARKARQNLAAAERKEPPEPFAGNN